MSKQEVYSSPPASESMAAGLGESFKINLNTGQGVYTQQITIPDGVAGFTPKIMLEYSSARKHTSFGWGWDINLRRIEERKERQNANAVYLESGQELMELADGSFGPKIEKAFNKYIKKPKSWELRERNGHRLFFGESENSRISDPENSNRIYSYLLSKKIDNSGNEITYTYLEDSACKYIDTIDYSQYQVKFLYEQREDERSLGYMGFLCRRRLRCKQITISVKINGNFAVVKQWDLAYEESRNSKISLLSSIQLKGIGEATDGSSDITLNPTKFKYTGDDLAFSFNEITPEKASTSPPMLNNPDTRLINMDNAPLPGILHNINGDHWYWKNTGRGKWRGPRKIHKTPIISDFNSSGAFFVDKNGSGLADMVVAGAHQLHGYFENKGENDWGQFRAYPRQNKRIPDFRASVAFSDVNKDGLIDVIQNHNRSFAVWENQGDKGWSEPKFVNKTDGSLNELDLSSQLTQLADMTGDGSQDLVRIRSGQIEYWQNLGDGNYGSKQFMHKSPRLVKLSEISNRIFFIDVNHSGCADLVIFDDNEVQVYFNIDGKTFSEPLIFKGILAAIPDTIIPIDFYGNGNVGLLFNSLGGKYIYLEFKDNIASNLLHKVNNGFGLESTINYKNAIDDYLEDFNNNLQWKNHFPFPLTVVESTEEEDLITGQLSKVSMTYHEAHFETRKRQFQGFKKVDRIEHGDESRPSSLTCHYYYSGEELIPDHGNEHAVLNGLLQKKEVFSIDSGITSNNAYTIEEAEYELSSIDSAMSGEERFFIAVKKSIQIQKDNTNDERQVISQYEYDKFGNVVKEIKIGKGMANGNPKPSKTSTTVYEYAINESNWIIDRICKKVVRDQSAKILSEVRNYYDGQDFKGLELGKVTKGLRIRQEVMVLDKIKFDQHYNGLNIQSLGYHIDQDSDGNDVIFINKERFAYDLRGLKVKYKDSLGAEEEYTFDSDGLFKSTCITSLGQTTYEYDKRVGKVTKIVNVDGAELQMFFDAMSRTRAIFLPNNTTNIPSRTYDFDDSVFPIKRITKHYLSDDLNKFTTIHTYFDGRLKEVQKKVEETVGSFITSSHQVKNPLGDVKFEYEQFKSTHSDFEIPDIHNLEKQAFKFDVLGRPVSSANFFGGLSTASYEPFRIITKNPIANEDIPQNHSNGTFGLRKIEQVDVFNQRTRTVQETENGGSLTLDYKVDTLGEITEIKDAHGVQAEYLYDNLGNRLLVKHREAGIRKASFNALGQPVRGIDAKGQIITAEYEPNKHRLKKLLLNGSIKEEYIYDDVAQGANAKLAQVNYENGSQKYFYDISGRLIKKEYIWNAPNRTETVEYEFDRIGRQTKVVHTDGTEKAYNLYGNGWIKSIDDFVDDIKYDSHGNPVEIHFNNGVKSTRNYSAGGRKISKQRTQKGGGDLEHLDYTYDVLGNVSTVTDILTNKVTEMAYDSLEQILSSTTDGITDFNYSYENNLNLSLFEEGQKQLEYNDPMHFHRLTDILDNGNNFSVGYDNNGNITSLPGRQFNFNFKNELVQCVRDNGLTANYFYDHKGKRVRKTVINGGITSDTFFIDDEVEYKNSSKVYYYNIGKVRLGMKINGDKRFVHNSYLSSSGFFTDTNGTQISSISYKPFGNIQTTTGMSLPTTFASHPFDEESGLYYMQKRYYAPEIGRFISADLVAVYLPKQIMGDPVSMHSYAYAGNNPSNNIDLNGTSFWSVVGGIVGALVGVALAVFLGPLAAILIGIAVVGISYALASANVGNDFGEFMRGFMIGFNAGMNMVFATALFGPVIGVAIGVINFLAVEESISRNPVYEGILGWASWLMPMSWLVTGLGLLMFVVNLIAAGVTGNQVPAAAITSIQIDWRRGMIGMEGGLIRAAGGGAAFNMGNFSFYDPGSLWAEEHEIGHGLSLGAFGWAFHYIGAIDQALDPDFGGTGNVYAENIAESSARNPAGLAGGGWPIDPSLDMWQ